MATVKEITSFLEQYAPKIYQESYDNSGLICGNYNQEVTGILTALDTIESIVDEAIAQKCNLIVAHHPILFKGLKKLTGSNYIERTIIKAIKNDISIYAIHTNLDNVTNGVNFKIAQKIGLKNTKILAPKNEILRKLVVFVPITHTESLAEALHKAGAGNIGNYSNCSFRVEGTGTFKPNENSNPFTGEKEKLEFVSENRIEIIYPIANESQILNAMRANHPYEEVAYYINSLENYNQEIGSGAIGELDNPMQAADFMQFIKKVFNLSIIKVTSFENKKTIQKVAVCGGAGQFLLSDAKRLKADIFITSDVKYHEFFDADGDIILADISHYESEVFTKELIYEIISNKFPNIAVLLSKTSTNPVQYI
jgi:dinuclear metal center YbgI/SA1388 family protein